MDPKRTPLITRNELLSNRGITLTELLIVLAIFAVVTAVVYGVYVTQIRHTTREHRIAESEMELEIIKNFLERDIAMAGYGLADDYDFDGDGDQDFSPVAIAATNATQDTLTMMGTALGRFSRGSQTWSYISQSSPLTFASWTDTRESIQNNDRVIYVEPNTKTLLASGSQWQFVYPNSPTTDRGTLVYGLHTENSNFPYYAVEYQLGGTPSTACAPPAAGTDAVVSLLRAESKDNIPPLATDRQPILDCVRDLQVAFGLDINEDGNIECWDNGGTLAATYDSKVLRRRLKQVKVYMLVQLGMRDSDNEIYPAGQSFRVGDNTLVACSGGTVGSDVTLTTDQRRYRWTVLSLGITPRNLR